MRDKTLKLPMKYPLPAVEKISWLALLSLVSLLSNGPVQPESTYSFILKV